VLVVVVVVLSKFCMLGHTLDQPVELVQLVIAVVRVE
jgi:hypothetical protein